MQNGVSLCLPCVISAHMRPGEIMGSLWVVPVSLGEVKCNALQARARLVHWLSQRLRCGTCTQCRLNLSSVSLFAWCAQREFTLPVRSTCGKVQPKTSSSQKSARDTEFTDARCREAAAHNSEAKAARLAPLCAPCTAANLQNFADSSSPRALGYIFHYCCDITAKVAYI